MGGKIQHLEKVYLLCRWFPSLDREIFLKGILAGWIDV